MWGDGASMKKHGASFQKRVNHWTIRKNTWRWVNTWIGDMFGTSFEPKVAEWYSQYIPWYPHDFDGDSAIPRFQGAAFHWISGGRSQQISWENPHRVFAPGFRTSVVGQYMTEVMFNLKHSQRRCRIYRWFVHHFFSKVNVEQPEGSSKLFGCR